MSQTVSFNENYVSSCCNEWSETRLRSRAFLTQIMDSVYSDYDKGVKMQSTPAADLINVYQSSVGIEELIV